MLYDSIVDSRQNGYGQTRLNSKLKGTGFAKVKKQDSFKQQIDAMTSMLLCL